MNLESGVVGLFPSFTGAATGGVQCSGREAWQGIVDHVGENRACALQYETGASKAKTVLAAIAARPKTRAVLVWHMSLLKLLPFVDPSCSRGILFLHGVEAWRKQDVLTDRLARRVGLFLTNSDYTWANFIRINPSFERRAHKTVHLGVGHVAGAATHRPSEIPAVVMIGRLDASEDYKGHREMIAAWPRVLLQVPTAELHIVGDGDLRGFLENLAVELGVGHAVRFFGRVVDEEKSQLIAAARCLALPSRGEGFGLVYAEAMRLGRPCLVSNVDAGREVVNPPEAGLAVDPNDPTQIVDACCRMLCEGSEWDGWSARAKARYQMHFTGEHFRSRLLTALLEH